MSDEGVTTAQCMVMFDSGYSLLRSGSRVRFPPEDLFSALIKPELSIQNYTVVVHAMRISNPTTKCFILFK